MISKPKQRRRYSSPLPDEALMRRFWRMQVIRGGCVMCKTFPLTREQRKGREQDIAEIQGHHVLAKRHLRSAGLEDRFWDTRNGIALCSYHHHRHEWRIQPVPYTLLPDGAIEFATEVSMVARLAREYV